MRDVSMAMAAMARRRAYLLISGGSPVRLFEMMLDIGRRVSRARAAIAASYSKRMKPRCRARC